MICAAIYVTVVVVVLLVLAWFGGALWESTRSRPGESDELLRLRREAQTYREDALRWKCRALRRGWKPGQAAKNR